MNSSPAPGREFLTAPEPLVFQVARWLADQSPARPVDLTACCVIVPTAGAARRLRAELARVAAERGTGVLPPRFTTPMGLPGLDDPPNVARPAESLLAWADTISRANPEDHPLLLSAFADPERSALQIARSLREVCALLAEAGLTPASAEIVRACPQDEDRWREMAALYRRYLRRLDRAGRIDPNESHIAAAREGRLPAGITRLVVAGVPDLPPLVETLLRAAGREVTILIHAPDCNDAVFDAWGRPDESHWSQRELPLPRVLALADPNSEAGAVARVLGSAGLCVTDPALLPAQARALAASGRSAFDPSGLPLSRFACVATARKWMAFCRTRRLADLRALAEHPAFLLAFGDEAGLTAREIFDTLDVLTTTRLVGYLPEAVRGFGRGDGTEARLVNTAEKWRTTYEAADSLDRLPAFLEKIHTGFPLTPGDTSALTALGDILHHLLESPLPAGRRGEELLAAETESAVVYGPHEADAVELNGWLEAAWLPHEALVVSGCTEGTLPSVVTGHPFLPDSLRATLGLTGNARRLARDSHLFHCLTAARRPGKVLLTLSRTGPGGEPAKPSRLLFRCADTELPGRVRRLFGAAPSLRRSNARQNAWKLAVPELPPPATLRVTAFGNYLDCPLRFYFQRVLKMDGVDPFKVEMDALDFGSLLHLAIEDFSVTPGLRDSQDPEEITTHVHAALDRFLKAHHGPKWSLPLRVQRESLRTRLRKFAHLQAAEAAAGWRIVEAEVAFRRDDTLHLSGLPVTGQIDRVEVHQTTGHRRILDYKTYKSARTNRPEITHYGRPRDEGDLPESLFELNGKPRRWRQLQLPLYRALAAFRWPDDPAPAVTGYFMLPEKIEESGVMELTLDEPLFESAMTCAAAVADHVRRGIFWPPRRPDYESFEEIFLGRDPAELLRPESVAFLAAKERKEHRE